MNKGSGKLKPTTSLNSLNGENATKDQLILNKASNNNINNKPTHAKNDVVVEGIDDIKVSVASCCKPIPGDDIIGYITKGHGITIHRTNCPNINEIDERLIPVSWNDNVNKKYPSTILVRATTGNNFLLDVISKTSNTDIIIQSINNIPTSEDSLYEITVIVDGEEKLKKLIYEIDNLKNTISVERIIK